MVKNLSINAGDMSSILVLGRSPGGRHGNQLQYSCLENPTGQRNLVGYSPWGHKELRHNVSIKQQHKQQSAYNTLVSHVQHDLLFAYYETMTTRHLVTSFEHP